jgi:hypothetical protein
MTPSGADFGQKRLESACYDTMTPMTPCLVVVLRASQKCPSPPKHLTTPLNHSTPPESSETRTACSLLPLKASSLLRGSIQAE